MYRVEIESKSERYLESGVDPGPFGALLVGSNEQSHSMLISKPTIFIQEREIQSTTMTSLPFSHTLSFSFFPESPPQHHGKQILLRNPEIPLSPTNFSSGSSTLCRNGNGVSPRRRFNAKPAKSEADIDQTSQVTEEKITVTENAGNPSTSFLSVLCPLLKLFGVKHCHRFLTCECFLYQILYMAFLLDMILVQCAF